MITVINHTKYLKNQNTHEHKQTTPLNVLEKKRISYAEMRGILMILANLDWLQINFVTAALTYIIFR